MPITYQTPGSVTPYGNERTNPEGSPYPSAAPTAMGAYSTSDLERAIFEQNFDNGFVEFGVDEFRSDA